MKLKLLSFPLATLAATTLVGASAASAGVITFDPFPSIPSDVTVQYFDGGLTGPLAALPTANSISLVSAISAIPSGGDALLLNNDDIPFGPYGMLLTFSSLQQSVGATGNDFGGNQTTDNEIVHLSVFDIGGTLLGSTSAASTWDFPDLKPININVGGNLIKYAAFTYTVDLGYYAVDDVEYAAADIPEPATLGLLGIGLASIGFIRRRRNMAS